MSDPTVKVLTILRDAIDAALASHSHSQETEKTEKESLYELFGFFDEEEEEEEESLWDNPPAKAASWPNVGRSVPSWPTVQMPAPQQYVAQTVHRVTVGRDTRFRACVPSNLTRAIGLNPDEHVYISHRANGTGLVLLTTPSQRGHISTYKVDKDGNVRLSASLLKRGGLNSAARIKFRTSNDGKSILVMAG